MYNKMSTSSYKIFILNNGENYILAFEKNEFCKNIIDSAISLYEQIDISIDLIELNINVTENVKNYIKSICGRLIPYTNTKIYILGCDKKVESVDIIDRFKIDIKNIIEFYSIKNFWSTYTDDKHDIVAPKQLDLKLEDTYPRLNHKCKYNYSEYADINKFDNKILPPNFDGTDLTLNPISSKKLSLEDIYENYSYIIFNNIFNVSLFVNNQPFMKELCEEFTEFEIVEMFNDKTNHNIIDGCNTFFHKKSFSNKKELSDKIESFKKLFDMDKVINEVNEDSEKEKVFRYLSNMYIISEDPTQKISATELYNIIGNHLCIDYNNKLPFRKRLTGYLIETGLIKKRYSNGYYYYGIKSRYDNINGQQVSIDEIMQKRKIDKSLWAKPDLDQFSKDIKKDWKSLKIDKFNFDEIIEKRTQEKINWIPPKI
jgi:hypothetical protein